MMSPLTRFPDVSGFTPTGLTYGGLHVVCAKATQGTSYVNPQYEIQIGRAHDAGASGFAYHFLEAGRPEAQAEHAFDVVRKRALMIDHEPWPDKPGGGSFPALSDLYGFIDHYRKIGGITHVSYFPHWYWEQRGSPDLGGLRHRNMYLWSSNYPAAGYTDNGPGWDAYGGSHPLIWQYTDRQLYRGARLDFSAAKYTADDLMTILSTGSRTPVVTKKYREWKTEGKSSMNHVASVTGMAVSTLLRVTVQHFGPFDDVIAAYINDAAAGKKTFDDLIPAGGRLWVRDLA